MPAALGPPPPPRQARTDEQDERVQRGPADQEADQDRHAGALRPRACADSLGGSRRLGRRSLGNCAAAPRWPRTRGSC
jgi:hypothetical protein